MIREKQLTCIICPNGCEITVRGDAQGIRVFGAACGRGEAYAQQELVCPMRTIATSVRVRGGEAPLASVRLTKPVPAEEIMRVVAAIRAVTAEAPVAIGDILLENVLGLGSDVIATRPVARRE